MVRFSFDGAGPYSLTAVDVKGVRNDQPPKLNLRSVLTLANTQFGLGRSDHLAIAVSEFSHHFGLRSSLMTKHAPSAIIAPNTAGFRKLISRWLSPPSDAMVTVL